MEAQPASHAAHPNADNSSLNFPRYWMADNFSFDKVSEVLDLLNNSDGECRNSTMSCLPMWMCWRWSMTATINKHHQQEAPPILTPCSTNCSSSSICRPSVGTGRPCLGRPTHGSPTLSDQATLSCPLKLGPGDSTCSHTADEYPFTREEGIALYRITNKFLRETIKRGGCPCSDHFYERLWIWPFIGPDCEASIPANMPAYWLAHHRRSNRFSRGSNVQQAAQNGGFTIEAEHEDMHSKIEHVLTQRLGDGKNVHRPFCPIILVRSYVKHELVAIKAQVAELFDLLLTLAEKHKNDLIRLYAFIRALFHWAMAPHLPVWWTIFTLGKAPTKWSIKTPWVVLQAMAAPSPLTVSIRLVLRNSKWMPWPYKWAGGNWKKYWHCLGEYGQSGETVHGRLPVFFARFNFISFRCTHHWVEHYAPQEKPRPLWTGARKCNALACNQLTHTTNPPGYHGNCTGQGPIRSGTRAQRLLGYPLV